MTDSPENLPAPTPGPRKRCPDCSHENRLSAKICTQCGHLFRSIRSQGQKYCPNCGTVNKLEAKVCTHCAHRFRTKFSISTGRPVPVNPPAPEPPVTQIAPDGLELPPTFERPRPPRLPNLPAPRNPAPITLNGATTPDDPLNENAEPAPDITDDDFESLRRSSRTHTSKK